MGNVKRAELIDEVVASLQYQSSTDFLGHFSRGVRIYAGWKLFKDEYTNAQSDNQIDGWQYDVEINHALIIIDFQLLKLL